MYIYIKSISKSMQSCIRWKLWFNTLI